MKTGELRVSPGLVISAVGVLVVCLTALRLSARDGALLIGLVLVAFGGIAALVAELRGMREALLADRSNEDRLTSPSR